MNRINDMTCILAIDQGPRINGATVTFKCDYCGVEKTVKQSNFDKYQEHFCSDSCSRKQKRRPLFLMRHRLVDKFLYGKKDV